MIWNVNGRMRFLWLMPLWAVNNVNFSFQPGHTLFFYFQSAVYLPCFRAWLQATPTVMSSEQPDSFSGSSSLLSKSLSVSRFLKTTHNKTLPCSTSSSLRNITFSCMFPESFISFEIRSYFWGFTLLVGDTKLITYPFNILIKWFQPSNNFSNNVLLHLGSTFQKKPENEISANNH